MKKSNFPRILLFFFSLAAEQGAQATDNTHPLEKR
ncbi:hypothetical protein SLEP1_g22895 [Rubroshorea leprosula]|uniref:Uncharacterized protein n=1 Tax=Rubroshorea leprosula TaxID=152421 RepID=A0AAV5JLJ0_9ROSI|nr:hypothetical protein SLEP1_g22895 [Rubroshorea leprosula]